MNRRSHPTGPIINPATTTGPSTPLAATCGASATGSYCVKLIGTGQPPQAGARYPDFVATHGAAPPPYPAIDDE